MDRRQPDAAPASNAPVLLTKLKAPKTQNIIVFGGRGAGKSSIINMLVGKDDARTGHDAIGATAENVPYETSIKGSKYKLWDTAGLNEGVRGKVPTNEAFHKLGDLILTLSGDDSEGVSLLVYCIFGSRFGLDHTRYNYDIFVRKICENKVPVVMVITGLENEEPMEGWWTKNEKEFLGMPLKGHACVTAIKGRKDAYKKEYGESTATIQAMIKKYCPRSTWKVASDADSTWNKHVELVIRGDRGSHRSGGKKGKRPSDKPAPSGKGGCTLLLITGVHFLITFDAHCILVLDKHTDENRVMRPIREPRPDTEGQRPSTPKRDQQNPRQRWRAISNFLLSPLKVFNRRANEPDA
ncbi:hypothetical protein D9756_010511 [Leucocoprinus leucothites]|uniref:G domain-containing protein n=1 Tax=Leucocoprinus leucothites TaxID=201217 RepID=A0A8H5FT78_9AGAR|nr:hypothetical protein D9756_010511 [Leucoagaricus leucothites]